MDKKTFDAFRDVVYNCSGISLGANKEALVSARVAKRMRALNIPTHQDYLRYVEQDKTETELVQLIDAISTNVTSFFREPDHFVFMRDAFAKWSAQGQRRFRIWCAASSSGEEPYSIATTLLDTLNGASVDARILATDISTKVLRMAQAGSYEKKKLDTVPANLKDRYFTQDRTGSEITYTAKPILKDLLTFRRLNLSTPPFPMRGPMDMIFCRNVMIYFDNTVRIALIREMFRLLKPGGYLLVGHAESLTGMVCDFSNVKPSIYLKTA